MREIWSKTISKNKINREKSDIYTTTVTTKKYTKSRLRANESSYSSLNQYIYIQRTKERKGRERRFGDDDSIATDTNKMQVVNEFA